MVKIPTTEEQTINSDSISSVILMEIVSQSL
jgi:hypothetical protein